MIKSLIKSIDDKVVIVIDEYVTRTAVAGIIAAFRNNAKELIRFAQIWVKSKLMVELIEIMQTTGKGTSECELLEVAVRRGSPLHKLWQDLHLRKYPGNY